jgi:Transmembrane protein family 132
MSQVMKVFIVTQAGKVADVTLQSSCLAEDESVIKVSAATPSLNHFPVRFSFVVVMTDESLIILQHPEIYLLVSAVWRLHSSPA